MNNKIICPICGKETIITDEKELIERIKYNELCDDCIEEAYRESYEELKDFL